MNNKTHTIKKSRAIWLITCLIFILSLSLTLLISNSNANATESNDVYYMKGKVLATSPDTNKTVEVKNALIIFDSNEGTKTTITDENAAYSFEYQRPSYGDPKIYGNIFIVSERYSVYEEYDLEYVEGSGPQNFYVGTEGDHACAIENTENNNFFDVEVYRQEPDFHVLIDKITFTSQFCVADNTKIKLNAFNSLYFNVGPEYKGITIEIRPPKNTDLGFKCWLDNDKNLIDLTTEIDITDSCNFYALFGYYIDTSLDYGCNEYSCTYYYNGDIDHKDTYYGEESTKITINENTTIKHNNDNTVTISYSDTAFSRNVSINISINSKPYYEFEKWTLNEKVIEKGQQIEIKDLANTYKLSGSHKAKESCHTVTFDKTIENGYIIDAPGILVDNCVVPDGAKLEKNIERDTGILNIWNQDQSSIIYQFYAVPKNDDPSKTYAFDKWVVTDNIVTITSDIDVSAIFKTVAAEEVNLYGYIETQITPQTKVPIKNAIVVFIDNSNKVVLSSTTNFTGFFNFYIPANSSGNLYVYAKDFTMWNDFIEVGIEDYERSIVLTNKGYKCSINTNLENTYAVGQLFYQKDESSQAILLESIPIEDTINVSKDSPFNMLYINNGNEISIKLDNNFILIINPEDSFNYIFKHILDNDETVINEDKTIALNDDYELSLIYAWKIILNFNEGIDYYSFTKTVNDVVKDDRKIRVGDKLIEGLYDKVDIYREVDLQKQSDSVKFTYYDTYSNENISYKFSSSGLDKYNLIDWKLNDASIEKNKLITISEINYPLFLSSIYEGVSYVDGYIKADSGFNRIENNDSSLFVPYANKEVIFNNTLDGKTYKATSSNEGYYKIDLPNYSFGTLSIKDDDYGPIEGTAIEIPEILPASSQTNNFNLNLTNPITCKIINATSNIPINTEIFDAEGNLLHEFPNFYGTFFLPKSGCDFYINDNNFIEYNIANGNLVRLEYANSTTSSNIFWCIDNDELNIGSTYLINENSDIYLKELINPQNSTTATTSDNLTILACIIAISAAIALILFFYSFARKRKYGN